jgi:hypothetical protein
VKANITDFMPQIGPYEDYATADLTERTLGSKAIYGALERLIRGDETPGDFIWTLATIIENESENLEADLKDEQGIMRGDAS